MRPMCAGDQQELHTMEAQRLDTDTALKAGKNQVFQQETTLVSCHSIPRKFNYVDSSI